MKRNNRRNLTEAAATIEVAIAKCLGQAKLHPSELEEIFSLTAEDLMTQHELDYLLAEKVRVHAQLEMQRCANQGLLTWQPDSREKYGSFTRTHPIAERFSLDRNVITELSGFEIEDITDIHHDSEEPVSLEKHSDGRMLDYGHVKSDSHEGRMMKQALYQISEYGKELHDMLDEDDDLPQWCHYKVAVARACVSKVKHYLEYKIKKESKKIP